MIKAAILTVSLVLVSLLTLYGCGEPGYTGNIQNNDEEAEEHSFEETAPESEDETNETEIDKKTEIENGNNTDGEEKNTQMETGEENANPENSAPDDDVIVHQEEDEILLRVAIYRTSHYIYLFSVSQNGILETTLGEITDKDLYTGTNEYGEYRVADFSDDLSDLLNPEKIEEHHTQQLSRSQLEYILEMADKTMEVFAANVISMHWTWNMYIYYNGQLQSGYPYIKEGWPFFRNLTDTLLLLSPVTKLHDGEPDEAESTWKGRLLYYEGHGWEVGRIPPDAEYPHDY